MQDEIFVEALVPNELIVGIVGELCYVTYMDGNKINSEKSWTNWSENAKNPLKIKNKFSTGFKLGGVNGRWSRQAANADNLLIMHPLFNKCFEISLDRFIKIARRSTIVNGVIDAELIMDKHRNIIFRDEYESLVVNHNKKIKEQNKIKEKNLETKVKNADQVPGKFYKDSKTNNEYVYLGTAKIDGVLKYIYIDDQTVKSVHKTAKIQLKRYIKNTWTFETLHTLKYPSICNIYGYNYDDYELSKTRTDYESRYLYSDNDHKMRIVSAKISMSSSNNKMNIFDSYTEDDWKIVDRCYTKDLTNDTDKWGRSTYETVLKGTTAVNNFRKDYEENKNKNIR